MYLPTNIDLWQGYYHFMWLWATLGADSRLLREVGNLDSSLEIMKRYGNLWHPIISFENLLLAARKAQRGKRFRPNVLEFNDRLESNLLLLQQELRSHTYQPGAYRTFEIIDPKPRIISAAPYRDRVVHHALCNIITEPIERSFITASC